MTKLSVLNLGLQEMSTPRATLTEAIHRGQLCEDLGYHRYWLGEHYGCAPWTNPRPLLPLILNATRKLRVGFGGLLGHLHDPFQVANEVSVLANIFGPRIDVGICRGGARGQVSKEEAYVRATHTLKSLTDLLQGSAAFRLTPPPPKGIEIWALGGSQGSAAAAVAIGCRYAFSLFHSSSEGVEALGAFSPALLAVAVLTASDDNAAYRLAAGRRNEGIMPLVVGSPESVARGLAELARKTAVSEILVLEMNPSANDVHTALSDIMSAWQQAKKDTVSPIVTPVAELLEASVPDALDNVSLTAPIS